MNAQGMNAYNAKRKPHAVSRVRPIAAACAMLVMSQFAANLAHANAGYGVNTDIAGNVIAVPTFYAGSPQGWQPALGPDNQPINNPATGAPYTAAEALAANSGNPQAGVVPMVYTGAAMRKFVDNINGAYQGLSGLPTGGIPMGLQVAIPDKWVDANMNPVNGNNDDYYEMAVVEYTQQLHSDLAKPTLLRGYVQIETPYIAAGATDASGIIKSEHIPGTYPDGTAILDANGKQVYFVHAPHYLGPSIIATKGKAVRVLFHNYLPYTDVNGKAVGNPNGGALEIPVDEILAGGGPLTNADGTPYLINGKPVKFGQNRASFHFHGGDTPWTNDGTPHQWLAPAGDISWTLKDATHPYGLGRGDSFHNVADMPDPGNGAQTMYFPNNQSGRLMFYHDHTSALTRLNVYYGEASGYIITDPVEQSLVASLLNTSTTATTSTPLGTVNTGLLDVVGTPLVVQDKVFVPSNIGPNAKNTAGQIQSQDTRWDLTHWGQPGDLYFPHVYEVNQDPNSIDGTNPVGRWDWGPWFWPVFPAQYSLPSGNYGDVTTTPEAFVDTAMVNGQAYPTMNVDPKTYRFRILSAGNDRSFNLGLYQAVDANGVVCDANNTSPAVNATAPGETNAPATCTEVRMVPATTTSNLPAGWPTDGRAGGVPDPATAGPAFVQIGNEAGLLPKPAIWNAQPITYDQNVRSMTVYNVLNHQLLLMPAERADVLVDFSAYAGKTLIMYNDAPAPLPGFDPRSDYFSNQGDQTIGGGSYNTLPGYGPATRTVMQFKVSNNAPAPALDLNAVAAQLPVAYAASRPQPIVPETVYGTSFPNGANNFDNYARIFTGSNTQPAFVYPMVDSTGAVITGVQLGKVNTTANIMNGRLDTTGSIQVLNGGSGYTTVPNVTFNPAPQGAVNEVTPTATAIVSGGVVTGIVLNNMDTGYFSSTPTITIDAPAAAGGTQATAQVAAGYTVPAMYRRRVINKGIQELFDPVYGRMNATLSVELPFSSATVATTIPLAYVDTPVDYIDGIKDGETQIWKITHNGVDSHPVHFHLVNVQVINRVDWAGVVKPPAPNEVGWKETLRMNPLEDVYVAVRAEHPVVPFGLPRSQRLLDPSQATGAQLGLTQIDPLTGAAPTYQTQLVNGVSVNVPVTAYSNQLTDFDNEYVWHCHILGHEENDFMRPFIFHPNVVVPDAPGNVQVSGNTVTWIDPTPFGGQDAQGIPTAGLDANGNPQSSPKNEIGFRIYAVANGTKTQIGNALANTTSWTGTIPAGASVVVTAWNAAGESATGTSTTAASGSSSAVAVNTAAVAANTASLVGAATTTATAAASAAATAAGVTAADIVADAALAAAAPVAPAASAVLTTLGATGSGVVSMAWMNPAANIDTADKFTNVTSYTLTWGTSSWTLPASTALGLPSGATIKGLASGTSYTFNLVANNGLNATTLSSAPVSITVVAP